MKLSVMLKAYNHEPFIAQALESALAQRTAFPFEILVGEDRSSDRTREIVQGYAARHPGRVRLLDRPCRVGMVRNTMDLYLASDAEYLAWLDGDDYWTSSEKLQRQVDLLDAKRHLTMCFHEADQRDAEGRVVQWSLATPGQSEYRIEDLLVRPAGFASTCVYRRVLTAFPEWFERLPFCDWPLQILHAAIGPAGWLPDVMCLYRAQDAAAIALGFDPGGADTRTAFWAPRHVEVYHLLNRHFAYRYDPIIRLELARLSAGGQALRRLAPERSRATRWMWGTLKRCPPAARLVVAVAGSIARGVRRDAGSPASARRSAGLESDR